MADKGFLSPAFIKGAQNTSGQNSYADESDYAGQERKKKKEMEAKKASEYLVENNSSKTKASDYLGN